MMRVNMTGRGPGSAVLTAIACLVVLLVSACGGGSSGGAAGGSLVLADGAQTLSAFNAPYSAYAPEHAWKDAGLTVDPELTQGGTQSAQLVASGKADVSIVGLSSALTVAVQSPDVKIIGVTGGNLWHLTVPTASTVSALTDLKGKTIGVQALNTGQYLYNRAALKLSGLDPDKDVTWLPVGTGAQAADAVNSGKVDAIATYDGPYEVISGLTKGGLRILPSPLDKLDGSGAWIVNAKVLADRRAEVVSFMQGMAKTAILAQAKPQTIISALWQKDPSTKPRNQSDADAMTSTLALVKAYWSKVANVGPEGMYGVLSDDAIAKAVQFHEDSGIVKGTVDIAKSFDMSVARDADKFDKTAVQTAAAGS